MLKKLSLLHFEGLWFVICYHKEKYSVACQKAVPPMFQHTFQCLYLSKCLSICNIYIYIYTLLHNSNQSIHQAIKVLPGTHVSISFHISCLVFQFFCNLQLVSITFTLIFIFKISDWVCLSSVFDIGTWHQFNLVCARVVFEIRLLQTSNWKIVSEIELFLYWV